MAHHFFGHPALNRPRASGLLRRLVPRTPQQTYGPGDSRKPGAAETPSMPLSRTTGERPYCPNGDRPARAESRNPAKRRGPKETASMRFLSGAIHGISGLANAVIHDGEDWFLLKNTHIHRNEGQHRQHTTKFPRVARKNQLAPTSWARFALEKEEINEEKRGQGHRSAA